MNKYSKKLNFLLFIRCVARNRNQDTQATNTQLLQKSVAKN